MRSRWLFPLLLLLVTNSLALGGVLWNRTGEPEAVVVLTERELDLPGAWYNRQEDSGLTLDLRWRHEAIGSADFDRQKMRQLGFNVEPLPMPEEAVVDPMRAYRPTQSKPFLIVLEVDGAAWRQSLEARRREEPSEWLSPEDYARRLRRAEVEESRLRVVDAGPDRQELRRRYPDRSQFLIVPGIVKMFVNYTPEASLEGRVTKVLVEGVHVPRRLREPLDALRQQDASATSSETLQPPRYRATVAFGRRLEPTLRRIELLDAEPVPLDAE